MAYPRLTRCIALASLLLFGASLWLVFRPTRSSLEADPASCAAMFEPGDVWVRWVEDGERAEITPVVSLGKETHRLERLSAGGAPDTTARVSPAHLVMGRDGLMPCYCGRAEQIWKQAALPRFDALAPGGRWILAMNECFPAPPPFELAFDRKRRGPLEVAMPAVGALRVRLWPASAAERFDSLATVIVRALDAGPNHPPHDVMRFSLAPGEERRLPDILVGRRFSIEAIAMRGELVERFDVEGPASAGEERQVEICFGDHLPLLRMRCVDEESSPIANHELQVTWCGEEGLPLFKRVRTREDGTASFVLEVASRETARGQLLLETRDGSLASMAALVLSGEGPRALDDVAFRRAPRVICGRVVDEEHRPVAHAVVVLAFVAVAEGDGDPIPLSLHYARTLTCDAHGRFAWRLQHAPSHPAYYAVSARGDGRGAPLRFVPFGMTVLDLVAEPAGSVAGRLALPAGLQGEVEVHLKPELAGLPVHGAFHSVVADEGGAFRLANLPAGSYALEVGFPRRPWPGLVPRVAVRNLVVRAGEPCRDPLLEEIDCRSVFTTFDFELTSAGRPLESTSLAVYVKPSDTIDTWHGVKFERPSNGTARLVLARGAYDFRFELSKYETLVEKHLESGRILEVGARLDPPSSVEVLDTQTWDPDLFVEVLFEPMPARSAARKEFERSLAFLWEGQALPWGTWERKGIGRYLVRAPSSGEIEVRWTLPQTKAGPALAESTLLQIGRRTKRQLFCIALTPR